ncbi:MAG TPA: prolipoprotein diacylglyceryl transferase [Anaerolineales bacterium]|nr:prolipoprotein diacylglyceryl transferase [Anaerolineales bacterium]
MFGIDPQPFGIEVILFGLRLFFRYYGMILMAGAIAAAYLASRLLREERKNPDLAWDGLLWVLIFGLVGARLYHVFTPSKSLLEQGKDTAWYLTHPLDLINTTQGGLAMPGAILGGVLGLYIFARRRKIKLGMMLDAAAPGVALAQAIGRWGNFVNQELYGPPTTLPWGIAIDPAFRLSGYESFERFHPLFLYESIWNLLCAAGLYWLWRNHRQRLRSGDVFIAYLAAYSVGRFLLEFIRLDFVPLFGINFNQMVMALAAVGAGLALYLRNRNVPQPAQTGRRGRRRSRR